MAADGEEDTGPKVNKASIDDEFLRHPASGAFIRNPLLDKQRSTPILFQAGEFDFNCLDDALAEYKCISVSETAFREMTQGGVPETTMMNPSESAASLGGTKGGTMSSTMRSTLSRAALTRLNDLRAGYEFVVTLRKSQYQPPRTTRRRPLEPRTSTGILVDKVNLEVTNVNGKTLRVETINEGLISRWNQENQAFQVRQGDVVVKVNAAPKNAEAMLEEMQQAPDLMKLVVRRMPTSSRTPSRQDFGE
eukprot:TRINITY_DN23183_c0_g1_i1.p1 TRINITY_DN23183_c0_g1~~TRINITY_DN23183_c0_g1_i1.p1  ORF type:complete len:249 (-),score=67.44 TRINITY_DN23183_c0_g1_i1:177-923(-)